MKLKLKLGLEQHLKEGYKKREDLYHNYGYSVSYDFDQIMTKLI